MWSIYLNVDSLKMAKPNCMASEHSNDHLLFLVPPLRALQLQDKISGCYFSLWEAAGSLSKGSLTDWNSRGWTKDGPQHLCRSRHCWCIYITDKKASFLSVVAAACHLWGLEQFPSTPSMHVYSGKHLQSPQGRLRSQTSKAIYVIFTWEGKCFTRICTMLRK